MDIVMIPVDQIDGGIRLRPVDEDYAALIGASMAQHGQKAPIEVLPLNEGGFYKLISGEHRRRGAQLQGMQTIAAIVRDVDSLTAQLLEIDENLLRHELNELDRATFLLARKDVYEALYPETKRGAARWKNQNEEICVLMKPFTEDAAAHLGCSKRTVEVALRRVGKDGILPVVQEMIRGSWIARRGSHLDAIAKLDAAEQRAVVQLLLQPAEPGAEMTVAEAIRVVRQVPEPRVDVAEADYRKLLKLWKKADISAKAQFRAYLRAEGM